MPRFHPLLFGALLTWLWAAGDARADPGPPPPPAWVELSRPEPGTVLEHPAAWIEVRGRAGEGSGTPMDLVLAIDASVSALYPSGGDVDGDGITASWLRQPRSFAGRLTHPAGWTTDSDDTVLRAEIEAAWRLLRQLDESSTRVGLLSFSNRPRRRARVGDFDTVREALAEIRVHWRRGGTTDLEQAVGAGARLLAPSLEAGRRAVLVLLSDGDATAPRPEVFAHRRARRAAARAAADGVRLHAIAMGADPEGEELLCQMASLGGGQCTRLRDAGDILELLPYTRLSGIERVEMRNRTSDRPARAVRLFADGSFDGFVPLRPGANHIEIQLHSRNGAELHVEREVTYVPRAARGEGDLDALRALNRTLEQRAIESAMAARARARERALQIEVDAPPAAQP